MLDPTQSSTARRPGSTVNLGLLVSVLVVGGLLVSCCCPEHTWCCRGLKAPSQPSLEATPAPGATRMRLQFPNPLPVTRYHQEGIYSCWSTCGEMIMDWVGGVRVRQCEQADPPFFGEDSMCCDDYRSLVPGPN